MYTSLALSEGRLEDYPSCITVSSNVKSRTKVAMVVVDASSGMSIQSLLCSLFNFRSQSPPKSPSLKSKLSIVQVTMKQTSTGMQANQSFLEAVGILQGFLSKADAVRSCAAGALLRGCQSVS